MDKNKQLAREWFDSANSDFKYAELGLKESGIFPQTAFLAQQIAEKFLKGYLTLQGEEPLLTHDLTLLLAECVKNNQDLERLRENCESLNGFYLETRYPPDIPDYTKEEILEAFKQAKTIKEAIEKLLAL